MALRSRRLVAPRMHGNSIPTRTRTAVSWIVAVTILTWIAFGALAAPPSVRAAAGEGWHGRVVDVSRQPITAADMGAGPEHPTAQPGSARGYERDAGRVIGMLAVLLLAPVGVGLAATVRIRRRARPRPDDTRTLRPSHADVGHAGSDRATCLSPRQRARRRPT